MKKCRFCLLIALVYLAHQDFWNSTKVEPMFFGFLPVGLAYHAGYSVVCALLMAVLVKFAWPTHLEAEEDSEADKTRGPHS